MKFRTPIAFLLILAVCTGCAKGAEAEVSVPAGSALSAEQQEALGITQEAFDQLSDEEKVEIEATLDVIEEKEEKTESSTTAHSETPTTEPQEINAEEGVQKYLEKLPPLPSGDREYGYEWSNKLERITYYLITIYPASAYDVYDFMASLETEYGYVSDGKEMWDPNTETATYGYSTDTSHIYVSVTNTGNDGQEVSVTISISYNPFA